MASPLAPVARLQTITPTAISFQRGKRWAKAPNSGVSM